MTRVAVARANDFIQGSITLMKRFVGERPWR
jgi:hypothetical protein